MSEMTKILYTRVFCSLFDALGNLSIFVHVIFGIEGYLIDKQYLLCLLLNKLGLVKSVNGLINPR